MQPLGQRTQKKLNNAFHLLFSYSKTSNAMVFLLLMNPVQKIQTPESPEEKPEHCIQLLKSVTCFQNAVHVGCYISMT